MPARTCLPELIQCVVAGAVDRHGSALNPRLLNNTGHVRLFYGGDVQTIVTALDRALAALMDRGASAVQIELNIYGDDVAINLSGVGENQEIHTIDLPGQVSLSEPQRPTAGSPLLIGVKSGDAALLEYLGVLQTRLNFRCIAYDEIGVSSDAREHVDMLLIDARELENKIGDSVSVDKFLPIPVILMQSVARLDSSEEDNGGELIWPFFDSDLLLLFECLEQKRKLAVLVADDSAPSLLATRVMLELLGCDVTCAEDGNDALEIARSREFNLIFLDERMPGLNGSEVAHRLCQESNPNVETPKVSLTGVPDSDEVEKLYQQGITHHIKKPVTKLVLENFLNSWRNGA